MSVGQSSFPCSPALYALVTKLVDAAGEEREMELRQKWLDGSHDQPTVEATGLAWTALTEAIGKMEDEAIAGRAREAALQAEVERLTADDNTAADQFRVAIEEHLPEYALSSNDADLANHVERIEYAGEEIKRLTRDLAAARARGRR